MGSATQGTSDWSSVSVDFDHFVARFSKAPKTFQAYEAMYNCPYFQNKEVHRHETLRHEGKLVHIKHM